MDDHDRSEAQALRGIAATLTARGLEVTETTSADGLPELATNPAEPARGRIYAGPEGYLIRSLSLEGRHVTVIAANSVIPNPYLIPAKEPYRFIVMT